LLLELCICPEKLSSPFASLIIPLIAGVIFVHIELAILPLIQCHFPLYLLHTYYSLPLAKSRPFHII
jgi:hypothetical protein